MILSFKEQFKEPILNGVKIHSIRQDQHNRWKIDRIIHMATGVRTKKYQQFAEHICKSIQEIEIFHFESIMFANKIAVCIDGKVFGQYYDKNRYDYQLNQLAKNDGFKRVSDFFEWFDSDFKGKIIHWTDFKY